MAEPIDPELLMMQLEARINAPRYHEIEWDDTQRLYEQMTTLAMASGWNPMRDVMVLPRIPGGGSTLALITCPTTIDNESDIVALLRRVQADMGERGIAYAMWLHAFNPDDNSTQISMWCGITPSTVTHINVLGG